MTIKVRKSGDRGHFSYSWLDTRHTFSFGQYNDPDHMQFRSLRVINEDRVKPAVGFPLHAHKDMEIMSIVLSGGLGHQDDMGNGSILRPGQVQLMSAGTGVTHTELNASDKEDVHFLQIWILPDKKKLAPSYQEKSFSEDLKKNRWCLIASKEGAEGSLNIHQDVKIYLSRLDDSHSLHYELAEGRYGWVQVIEGSIALNEVHVEAGDGASISQEKGIEIRSLVPQSYILFFDLS